MARPSTLPGPWLDLANAMGGATALRNALGWPYMVFFRRARGIVKIPKADRMLVEQLAKLHNLPSPLKPDNLAPLELLGEALKKGWPVADEEIEKLKRAYDTNELIALAEDDETPEVLLRAAGHLLDV